MDEDVRFEPCPWCKHRPRLQLTDEEGNFRDKSYLSYSGVGYVIVHTESQNCPIATQDDGFVGNTIYDTEEEAIKTWNSWKKS